MTTYLIVEVAYNAAGQQIDSETVAEFATLADANTHVERQFADYGHAAADGSYGRWHIEAA